MGPNVGMPRGFRAGNFSAGQRYTTDEARQVLTKIYGWFTEGFETKDLQEARALLEALI